MRVRHAVPRGTERARRTPSLVPAVITLASIAVLPAVRIAAANPVRSVAFDRLAAMTAIFVAVMAVPMVVAGRRGGRPAARRAACVTGVVALLFFSYQTTTEFNPRPDDGSSLLWWWIVTLLALVAIVPLSGRKGFQEYMALLGVGLALVPVVATGLQRPDPSAAATSQMEELHVGPLESTPNIYFLLVDGYARADVLEEMFPGRLKLDSFRTDLEGLGFVFSPRATANYGMTDLSVPSTLQMSYLFVDGDQYDWDYLKRSLAGDNQVVDTLRRAGYQFWYAPASTWATPCAGLEDRCIQRTSGLTETELAVLKTTPLHGVASRLHRSEALPPNPRALLETVLEDETRSPRFLFAHIMSPHPPYLYDRNCDIRRAGHITWSPRDRDLYADAVLCLNQQLRAAVRHLVERDPTAAIIIQADHGPGFTHDLESTAPVTEAAIRERFSILSAIRLGPQCPSTTIPADLTPVNTFRVLFGCLSGRSVELLQNRGFLSFHGSAGRGSQVTRLVPDVPADHPQIGSS